MTRHSTLGPRALLLRCWGIQYVLVIIVFRVERQSGNYSPDESCRSIQLRCRSESEKQPQQKQKRASKSTGRQARTVLVTEQITPPPPLEQGKVESTAPDITAAAPQNKGARIERLGHG